MKKNIVNILYYIFLAAAIVLIIYRLYLHNNNRNEEAETAQWIALGLLAGAFICRLLLRFLPKWFGYKPTREEIENKVHGE
jgi:hypothetical protein